MAIINIEKVIFEAPLHKSIKSLAKAFNVRGDYIRYRLMKEGKLMLVKSVIKMNAQNKEEKNE